MFLKFLGRGSAFNIKEGNTSAYIKDTDSLLLIDCGESIFERIINKNLLDGVTKVDVLITHLNSDHVGSLSSLIYYCFYVKKIKLNAYFPTDELEKLLSLNGNTNMHYNFIKMIDNGLKTKVNESILISKISTNHIQGMNCYGYGISIIDPNNYILIKEIYYSGDSSELPISSWILEYSDEIYQDTCLADYEGNVHLSLRKLCEIVPKEQRSKVYCMHLDNNVLIEKAKEEGFNVVEID
jgi:phosphoribosyl 1,2-cyclic phosphodiesterase